MRPGTRDISESLGKLPPQATELEETVLGAILLEKPAQEIARKILSVNHFYTEAHKEIFRAICDLWNENENVDFKVVIQRLKKNGKLELVGGASGVLQLTDSVVGSANIESHIRILTEQSIKRDLIQIASTIHHDAYEDTTDCFEVLDRAQKYLFNISRQNNQSSVISLDLARAMNEHGETVQGGETCRVDQLKDVYAWMRGSINGWYGWASDGKTEMRDFLKILKVKFDKWKFACFKPEDMDSQVVNGKSVIKANRIFKNLAWSLTGKTWNKTFSDKHNCPMMTLDEEVEALQLIMDHIFIVYPGDRRYKNILDEFKFLYEKHGIDGFEIDPFSGLILPDNQRGDEKLTSVFFDMKEFALLTNTQFDIINHARSMSEVKDKNGKYRVVNQFMQLGGSAWDMKMDGQFSIYRPERHIDPKDPKVHLWNLKQKQSQIVGVQRGVYEKIEFAYAEKQYYFDNVNPMNGKLHPKVIGKTSSIDFTTPKMEKNKNEDDLPF